MEYINKIRIWINNNLHTCFLFYILGEVGAICGGWKGIPCKEPLECSYHTGGDWGVCVKTGKLNGQTKLE